MYPATTVSEYVDLLDQAIYELSDLAVCAEEDLDDELTDFVPIFEAMRASLMTLREELATHCKFAGRGQDLEIMPRVQQLRPFIPFYSLLAAINKIYRCGLAESG